MSKDATPDGVDAARREISPEESAWLWERLRERWGPIGPSGPYWYPLNGRLGPPDVLVFRADAFGDGVPLPVLRRILIAHGVGRAWVLQDVGPLGTDLEMECRALGPFGSETYAMADGLDWLLYSSHEDNALGRRDVAHRRDRRAWSRWQEGLWVPPAWWRRPDSAH